MSTGMLLISGATGVLGKDALAQAGFEEVSWIDKTDIAQAWAAAGPLVSTLGPGRFLANPVIIVPADWLTAPQSALRRGSGWPTQRVIPGTEHADACFVRGQSQKSAGNNGPIPEKEQHHVSKT
jgi:hypothetical protein